MKIVYLTNNINQIGGIERVICQLSTYFANEFDYNIEIHSLYSKEDNVFFELSNKVKIIHHGKKSGGILPYLFL